MTNDRPTSHLAHIGEISNGHISARGRPIHFMFGSTVVFSGSADRMDGAISGVTTFNRYVGENNARGVLRLVTI